MESTNNNGVSHPLESLESPFVLHERFVEQLAQQGCFRNPVVREAFRSVPRHLFLPTFGPSEVYRDVAITTSQRAGVAVSSSSQPSFMAFMIDQLDLRPGQRVLEVGTGTGFNGAILSKLVGAAGCVVSMDIDPAVIRDARANLERFGFVSESVASEAVGNPTELTWFRREEMAPLGVVCRDGGEGDVERAPFDRIIVTAACWDIVPAWQNQLAVGGRLVIPLMLFPDTTLCVTFEKRHDVLISRNVHPCRFIAMAGIGAPPNVGWPSYEIMASPTEPRAGESVTVNKPNTRFELWLRR